MRALSPGAPANDLPAMLSLLIHNWPIGLFFTITLVLTIVALVSLRDGPLPYERRGVLLSPA